MKPEYINVFTDFGKQKPQDQFNDMRGKPGKQRQTTQLINHAIERQGTKLVARSTPGKWFSKSFQHITEKYLHEYGDGMLEEMAAAAMGGQRALDRAVEQGRVVKGSTKKGVEMFYIPVSRIGQNDTLVTKKGAKDIFQISKHICSHLFLIFSFAFV